MSLYGDSETVQQSDWKALEQHHLANRLFLIDLSLDLKGIGKSLANDEIELIERLINSNQMRRFTEDEVGEFKSENPSFNFLIIQPFVIVQYDLPQ